MPLFSFLACCATADESGNEVTGDAPSKAVAQEEDPLGVLMSHADVVPRQCKELQGVAIALRSDASLPCVFEMDLDITCQIKLIECCGSVCVADAPYSSGLQFGDRILSLDGEADALRFIDKLNLVERRYCGIRFFRPAAQKIIHITKMEPRNSLGLDLTPCGLGWLVKDVKSGIVRDWNKVKHADEHIMHADLLVKVNHVCGDPAEIIKEIIKATELTIDIIPARPQL